MLVLDYLQSSKVVLACVSFPGDALLVVTSVRACGRALCHQWSIELDTLIHDVQITFESSNAPLRAFIMVAQQSRKESRDFLQHLQQFMLMPREMSKVLAVASKCTSNLAYWGSILRCHTIPVVHTGSFVGIRGQRPAAVCSSNNSSVF